MAQNQGTHGILAYANLYQHKPIIAHNYDLRTNNERVWANHLIGMDDSDVSPCDREPCLTDIHDITADQPLCALSPTDRSALEQLINRHLGHTFPALALTVIVGGRVWVNKAWGILDPDGDGLPVQVDSLFDLASVTKLYVTTTFLTALSQGLVSLDTSLGEVIPTFVEGGPRPVDGGQDPHSKVRLPTPHEMRGQFVDPIAVTLRQILTHTAGLAPWRDVFNEAGPPPPPPDQADALSRQHRWRKALEALCRYPFVGQPGDTIRYSDLGLMLLGEATSRLHGTPGDLEAAVRARVLAPLSLATTMYNPLQHGFDRLAIVPTEDDPTWRKRRCWGEVHDENACGVGGVAGHAGLFAAAYDVAAFGFAWLSRDPRLGIGPPMIEAALHEQAASDGQRRGLGWALKATADSSAGDRFGPDSFGHMGFTGTSLWIDPERDLIVACLTNRVYPGRQRTGIHQFRRALHDLLAERVDGTC